MIEVDLDNLKAQIPERDFDLAYEESPRFKLAYGDAGTARGLWNFLLALKEAEVDNFATAYEIADHSKDLTHLCGLHKFRWRNQRWAEIRWFLTLVWHHPTILRLRPDLKEFIEFICENSRVQWGKATRPMGLMEYAFDELGADNPRLPWRTLDWITRHRPSLNRPAPLSEFWPYLTSEPNEEHDLLMLVDRAVPKTFSRQERGDLCQDLLVEILSGNLSVVNLLSELPNYVRKFWREMPNKYQHVSLDAPVFEGARSISLVDTLEAPQPASEDDLDLRPLYTARITAPASERPTTSDLASLLHDGWEANRLLVAEKHKDYGGFEAAARARKSDAHNTMQGHARIGSRLSKKIALNKPFAKVGPAWTIETASAEELRPDVEPTTTST